jgi:hypothetical protein
MNRIEKLVLSKPFVLVVWFGLSLFAVIKMSLAGHYNNYLVYKYSFINLVNKHGLYIPQPQYYGDTNRYGPVFTILIAPFTQLPDQVAVILWVIANAGLLYLAIRLLPLKTSQYLAVLLICAHELMTSSYNVQFNPMIAAFILLSFVLIKRKQDFWAALFIMVGAMTKLYGIVGLAFFFFSENKWKLVAGLVFWTVVLFFLPLLFTTPSFLFRCYHDWYFSLLEKNAANVMSPMQDISVIGMVRRVFNYPGVPILFILLPAILLFLSAYTRIKYFFNTQYQLLLLASTLIFTVIFSTSSESPTYIIAFVGVAIWFMNLNRPVSGFEIFLVVFALLVTSLSPSDLFPQSINRAYIKPYAFKALPCFVIWLRIVYDLLTRRFINEEN